MAAAKHRHSMASRLAAAGVSGELARLVTDHESPKVQRRYVHAEIQALREALTAARSRRSIASSRSGESFREREGMEAK